MWQPSQSILEYFCSSRRKPCTHYWSLSIPQNSLHLYQTQESPIYSFAVSIDLLFWTFHIKGIIPSAAFFFFLSCFFFCLINRHTFEVYWASLYCVSQILLFFFFFFLQIEVLWHLCIEQAYQHHFLQHLLTLCFCITFWYFSQHFKLSHYYCICYGDLW